MDKSVNYSLWEVLEQITLSVRNKRLADVFRFVSFSPFSLCDSHKHLRIEINYVKKGSCLLHTDNGSVSFREGDIMIIAPETVHQFEAGTHGTLLMQLEFLPDIFSRFYSDFAIQSQSVPTLSFLFATENKLIKLVNNVGVMRAIQRIVNELERKGPHYQYLVVMYYAELLILLYRYMRETHLSVCTNTALRKAVCYIQQNYQTDINITDIAVYANISDRYLRRLFAQNLHLSPLDYLNQLRVYKSVELLRNTDKSVKEVCFLCGFQSAQYFSRVFKRQLGLSPSDIVKP